jgi:hypothetical protein
VLDLPWTASDIVTLGDGSETVFDLYTATVIWDGEYREIDIAESETEPLIGMALLYGYRLQIDAIEYWHLWWSLKPNNHNWLFEKFRNALVPFCCLRVSGLMATYQTAFFRPHMTRPNINICLCFAIEVAFWESLLLFCNW